MAGGEIDTSFPLIKDGSTLKMIIRNPEKVKSKEGTSEMIVCKLETTEELKATNDQTIHPGHKVISRTTITPSEKREVQAIAKDLATIIQAAEGKGAKTTPRQVIDNPSILDGKVVFVKIGIQKEKDGFPASNTARFVPAE
jgi:SepF-like predicted cell division protein (DUF552 family)